MKKICCCVLGILYFCGISVFAETVSLNEIIEFAIENNQDLKKQEVVFSDAEKAYKYKWNAFLPSLSLSGGLNHTHLSKNSAENGFSWSAGARINFSLTAGIPYELQNADLTYSKQKLTYEKNIYDFRNKIIQTYNSICLEKTKINILNENLKTAQNQYELVARNYRNGLASELSLLQAQYSVESIKPQIKENEIKFQNDVENFYNLIGSKGDFTLSFDTDLEVKKLSFSDISSIIDEYIEKRFDVQTAYNTLEIAKLTKQKASMTSLAPSISLGENISYGGKISSGMDPALKGTFSLSVSIPLDGFIPVSKTKLALNSNNTAITTAELDLENTKNNARLDIQNKIAQIDYLWSTISLVELNCNIARRSYDLSYQGYRGGMVSQSDLISSRQNLMSAEQTITQTKANYIMAVYNLATSLNISVEELYEKFEDKSTN